MADNYPKKSILIMIDLIRSPLVWMQGISNMILGLSMAMVGFLLTYVEARWLSLTIGVIYIGLTVMYGTIFFKLNHTKEKGNYGKMQVKM